MGCAASSRATTPWAWSLLLLIAAAFPLAACHGKDGGATNPSAPSPTSRLVLSPASATVNVGGVLTFSASAAHEDGTTSVPSVTWSATGGTITSTGVYTAGATAGSFEVKASLVGGSLTQSAAVTVAFSVSPVVRVSVSPNSTTLATGGTQLFTVSAACEDGSALVPDVVWTATGGTITAGGLYTAGSTPGTFSVTATQQGGTLAATAAVTITAAVLQEVILTPSGVSLSTGATQQFSVSGRWSNGATTAPSVTFTATGGTVTAGGLYTAGSTPGTFSVTATQQGGTLAATAAVTITAAVLQEVILTPSSASLTTGATQQFSVSGRWSNGATTAPAVTYSATGGTVTAGGLYTAGSTPGTFSVTATQQGGTLADTSAVTITSPTTVNRYSTSFPLTENPISEGGQWINGGAVGSDWTNVRTTSGKAYGTQSGASYTDSTALIAGSWGNDQQVTATVYSTTPSESCHPEVELRLRSAISAHTNRGYEISWLVGQSSASYLIIVRWNGTLGDFSYLTSINGLQYAVTNGDVVSAKVVGDTIYAYKNGVLQATASDPMWTSGAPGMGFNLENGPAGCSGTNSTYGYTTLTATDIR